MSGGDDDPITSTDRDIDRIRAKLSAVQERGTRAAESRKRLFDEIARVELYLIRRKPKPTT